MPSLYRRKRSPFWWLRTRAIQRSTKLRWDSVADTRKAQLLLQEYRQLEHARSNQPERWEFWCPQFIAAKYAESPKSLARNQNRWRWLALFLEQRKIFTPNQLNYSDCMAYLPWRMNLGAHKNTAVFELRFLGALMRQAVRAGYAVANPCQKLGIGLQKSPLKPEITAAHLKLIQKQLRQWPQWMQIQFQIALHTGCRLREACVPLDDVDLKRRTIYFRHAKRGHAFAVPLPNELVALMTRLKQRRAGQRAFDMPEPVSVYWRQFFTGIGLAQYSFHCVRVTFISRGARAGVPEREMMRLVGHASTEIHRIYQRFEADDLRRFRSRFSLGKPA